MMLSAGVAGCFGLAALAGQGGQAAAADSEATVQSASSIVSLAAGREHATEAVTRSLPAREFLAPAPVVAPPKVDPPQPVEAPKQTEQVPQAPPAPQPEAKPAEPAPVAGLDQAQMNNAKKIVDTAKSMGLGKRAQVIAIATALQESNLYNRASTVYPESYDVPHELDGSDHDSVGLFQQRPASGWGPVKELMKPEVATRKFLDALVQVPGWEHLPVTVAAQAVQVSAFPDHYAKHESRANEIVDALNK